MIDLAWQYQQLKMDIDCMVGDVLSGGRYILGPYVRYFEKKVAEYHGLNHAIGVANGSDALMIALKACGVGKGDEVITVPNTFVATAHAIERCGATARFVDINPEDYLMSVRDLDQAVTYNTRAIVPVHLYGHPCDMDVIMDFAERHRILVVEDCAQAMGAEYRGYKVGTQGDVGCFSFFPTKTLGAAGDGGMIVTNNPDLRDVMDSLRRHGFQKKNDSIRLGLNSRLDEIQAAYLLPKLAKLDEWNGLRRAIAAEYNRLFAEHEDLPIETPVERPWAKHVYHLYVIKAPKRAELQKFLSEKEIDTQIHYENLVNQQSYYLKSNQDVPAAKIANAEILSLPIYPGMTMEQARFVAQSICEFYGV